MSDDSDDREGKMVLTVPVGRVSSSRPGLLTETVCFGIAGTNAETGRSLGEGSETGGWSTPTAGTIVSGKLLESMKDIKKRCASDKDSVITLFLHLSLLQPGVDQSLNPGRSTTMRTIATVKEKILKAE